VPRVAGQQGGLAQENVLAGTLMRRMGSQCCRTVDDLESVQHDNMQSQLAPSSGQDQDDSQALVSGAAGNAWRSRGGNGPSRLAYLMASVRLAASQGCTGSTVRPLCGCSTTLLRSARSCAWVRILAGLSSTERRAQRAAAAHQVALPVPGPPVPGHAAGAPARPLASS